MTDSPLADIDNIGFMDFETRAEPDVSASDGSVKTAGTYRYVKKSFGIILTGAVGNEPVWGRALERFDGDWLTWADMPPAFREFHKRVEQREAWYAAFNAGFDRNVWNEGTYDFPHLDADMVIDVMAQAVASNLPPALEGASRTIGRGGKQSDGKALINLFTTPTGATPQERPVEWQSFCAYALQDTDEMREVWRATRPLPLVEWKDYWVNERINERGVRVDLDFVARAARIADAEIGRLNVELNRWTNGAITAVTQAKRIADWVYDRLENQDARALLVKEWDENVEVDGEDVVSDLKVGKLSLDKSRIEALLAYFAALDEKRGLTEAERLIVDVLTARQFGGGSAFSKFSKMLDQHDGGRLKGMYVFNGAAQTGRYSSKGVQTHNLIRASLGDLEEAAIEFVNDLEI